MATPIRLTVAETGPRGNLEEHGQTTVFHLQHGRLMDHGAPDQVLQPALVQTVWQVRTHAVNDPAGVAQLLLAA